MSTPASFPLDSYECQSCKTYTHYTPPFDNGEPSPRYCPYCGVKGLVWRTDNNWRLEEVL